MEELIALLFGTGDDAKETLSPDEAKAALKGKKYVDLSAGEYVAKKKFDTAETKREEAETALQKLKDAGDGDEGLKAQITTLEREKSDAIIRAEAAERALGNATEKLTASESAKLVLEKAGHLSPKLQRTLLEDARKLVTDEFDFASAIDKAIADDSDYAPPAGDDPKKPPTKVTSGNPPKGVDAPVDDDEAFAAFETASGTKDDAAAE